jgi:acyl-coenzyme A synthetase/AMP-(fatty) acid ligase
VPKHLRRVIFSGAVISNKCLRIWQDHLPGVRFINQYGPTEATASCTWYEVREKVEEDTRIPIGRPYPHYRILLLDEKNQPAAAGQTGEICVGGPILALGYYKDPERTGASFIQNPCNNSYRDLIYRTGDLGRLREDGLLEFVGRMDRQIKHLGHRIELDEIEIEANKVSGVEECCALYDAEKSLLYLFYSGAATAREIALQFRAEMPAFMAPRKIKKLEELPKLPNGKIDMKNLRGMFR